MRPSNPPLKMARSKIKLLTAGTYWGRWRCGELAAGFLSALTKYTNAMASASSRGVDNAALSVSVIATLFSSGMLALGEAGVFLIKSPGPQILLRMSVSEN